RANSGSNNVSVPRLADQTVVSTLAVGLSPSRVAIPSSGDRVYVSNPGSGTVSVIHQRAVPTPSVIDTVSLGGGPQILSPTIPDWKTYGNALERVNYNANESTITKDNVVNLQRKWFRPLNGYIIGSTIIAQNLTIPP